jgi:hypothetical protein
MTGMPSAPGHDRSPAPSHSVALSVKSAPLVYPARAPAHIAHRRRVLCRARRLSFLPGVRLFPAFLNDRKRVPEELRSIGDIEGSAGAQSATLGLIR